MRKYLFFLVLVIAFGIFFNSCREEKATTTSICVLIDVSDKRFKNQDYVNENVPKFLSLMKLSGQTGGFSGGQIKLSLINELSDSKSKTIKIETGETGLMGENPLNRKDKVVKFQNELVQSFTQILEQANWGTNASKIYQKVTRELIKMKKSEADNKYLIIYSDMLENSSLFSFYGTDWKKNIEKLMADPEKALEYLSKKGPALPDLSEFEIFVIPSRTSENDEKINLSEQFWKVLFEFQGATISFNSSLEI